MSERNQIPEWSGGKLENGEFLDYSKEVSRIAHGFDAAKVPQTPLRHRTRQGCP